METGEEGESIDEAATTPAATTPVSLCAAFDEFRTALPTNNCLQGVKWSPDGSCLLTASEDRRCVHRFSYSPAAARKAEARTGERRRGASSVRNTTLFEHIATTSRAHRHLSTSTAAMVAAPACHSPRTCLHALDSDTWVIAGFGSSTCPMKRTNRVHRHRLRRPLLPHPRAPTRLSSRAHSLLGKASVSTIIVGTH